MQFRHFSYHLWLWLNYKSTHPSTLLLAHCLKYTLSFSFEQLENVQRHCLCLRILTLKRNIIWIKTEHTNTQTPQMNPYGIYSCLPLSGEHPPFKAANLFSSDRLVESHKAPLFAPLILCSLAIWQNAGAPWNDFKCQSLLQLLGLNRKIKINTCHLSFNKNAGIVNLGNS